ncbi:MAG: UDP-N-acetylmuramate--L-alanine ligase [Muribaculaceae bacterium]|nr:UDP-N-acetylmuramate--L-alanine ligase [Muribaculaceae bacterium]
MNNIPENIFFVGAGGIGMANLVRYFISCNRNVAGYDRTPSPLTEALRAEGADLFFNDVASLIPESFRNPDTTLVVYTPAVPDSSEILTWFRSNGFRVIKRAALLGEITRSLKGICVAGSHGKTSTTCMTAWILAQTRNACNAFLGGILRNTCSNLMVSSLSDYAVIEADEYDRSFHQLSPFIAVVTSTDPDHLDIYGDAEHYLEAFSIFTSLIRPGGYLLSHTGVQLSPQLQEGVTHFTYSGYRAAELLAAGNPEGERMKGDWWASDTVFQPGRLFFTLNGPDGLRIENIELGVPVEINIDNAVAAAAAAILAGADNEAVRTGLSSFRGARRRFEIWMRGDAPEDGGQVLIDDYAHSPNEVEASIRSVRKLYPGKKLTVIFQPHLYSRTRDFAPQFAQALSKADDVIMPEIYPARELPIPGISSYTILDEITTSKTYCERKDLPNLIKNRNFEILMTLGAADIDLLLPEIKNLLQQKALPSAGY